MKRLFFLLVCIVFIFVLCPITAAATASEIETASLSEEAKSSYLNNLKLEVIDYDDRKSSIQCFDVSENGTIALAIGGDTIYVHDQSGVFQYGIRFNCDGAWSIEFQGENLAIFFLRGSTFVLLDSTGQCIDIREVIEPNRFIVQMKEILDRITREINGKTYALERDLEVGDSYSRLVVKDTDGERIVLYDVTTMHKASQITLLVGIGSIFLFIFWGCVKEIEAKESAPTKDEAQKMEAL